MSKFKVGDKVIRGNEITTPAWRSFIAKRASGIYTVTAVYMDWIQVDNYVANGDAHPFHERNFTLLKENTHDRTSDSWDYAEADRLEQAARSAIAAYNAYIDRKPEKLYIPMYLPD